MQQKLLPPLYSEAQRLLHLIKCEERYDTINASCFLWTSVYFFANIT